MQSKIDNFQKILIDDVCSDVPNAFWHRKKHIVDLPYVKDFDEKNIPTNAHPIQMNAETVEFCKKEINDLVQKRHIINLSHIEDFPTNVLVQGPMMGSYQYFTDVFKGNVHNTKMITILDYPNILNASSQEPEHITWISTTNKRNNNIYTTDKWVIMTSLAERRNKGKAPAQGYSQDKRLPTGQYFVMHEGASSGVKPSRSTSLQEFVPAEVTYSSGDMVIPLQEVLSKNLPFHNGTYSKLPDSIKFILDNLQVAFTRNHLNLFQKTLQALEIHLVNLTA